MKKKIIFAVLMISITISVVACGKSEDKAEIQTENAVQTESTVQTEEITTEEAKETEKMDSVKDFDGATYSDMGKGTFMVCTAGGTSEEGNIPVLYVSEDDILVQIGDSARDMDGSVLTFVYIDGKLVTKEQMADYDGSLDLQSDFLNEGVHKVEAVQYKNDDPEDEVTAYKSGSYEVKAK